MTTIIGTVRNDDLLGTVLADLIFGDTDGTLTSGRGGKDSIYGGGNDDNAMECLIGDAANLNGAARGGNDRIDGGDTNAFVVLYGDAGLTGFDENEQPIDGVMDGAAAGGADTLRGAGMMYGDCYEMRGSASGGNDSLSAGRYDAFLNGEAYSMGDSSRGGNDLIQGGNDLLESSLMDLNGDGYIMWGEAVGGDDVIRGGDVRSWASGDGHFMSGEAIGGDDRLQGGAAEDDMAGDGWRMRGDTRGGDDHLAGGGGDDELAGDGFWMSATALGGDDALTGGYGADLFYFVGNFGKDVVKDFSGAAGEGDTLWFDVPKEELTVTTLGHGAVRIEAGDDQLMLTGRPEFDTATDIRFWDVDPLI